MYSLFPYLFIVVAAIDQIITHDLLWKEFQIRGESMLRLYSAHPRTLYVFYDISPNYGPYYIYFDGYTAEEVYYTSSTVIQFARGPNSYIEITNYEYSYLNVRMSAFAFKENECLNDSLIYAGNENGNNYAYQSTQKVAPGSYACIFMFTHGSTGEIRQLHSSVFNGDKITYRYGYYLNMSVTVSDVDSGTFLPHALSKWPFDYNPTLLIYEALGESKSERILKLGTSFTSNYPVEPGLKVPVRPIPTPPPTPKPSSAPPTYPVDKGWIDDKLIGTIAIPFLFVITCIVLLIVGYCCKIKRKTTTSDCDASDSSLFDISKQPKPLANSNELRMNFPSNISPTMLSQMPIQQQMYYNQIQMQQQQQQQQMYFNQIPIPHQQQQINQMYPIPGYNGALTPPTPGNIGVMQMNVQYPQQTMNAACETAPPETVLGDVSQYGDPKLAQDFLNDDDSSCNMP